MTVHNIAFQGYFDAGIFPQLGLPAHAWAIDGVEYRGGVGFLKAGLQAADAITTVEEGLQMQVARLGPEHPETLLSQLNLGHLYARAGRHSEATALWERALQGRE